jgi:hypothetical protein
MFHVPRYTMVAPLTPKSTRKAEALVRALPTIDIYILFEKKKKCPKGILPSGRSLHTKVGDGGWMGKLTPGLGRVVG